MAFDEFQNSRIGVVARFLTASVVRWTNAAVASRNPPPAAPGAPAPAYTIDALFEATRQQWVANWELWNHLSPFAGEPVMPTVYIRGNAGNLFQLRAQAIVPRPLFGLQQADFSASPLLNLTGANAIVERPGAPPVPPFYARPAGALDGSIEVEMRQNAPGPGVYQGVVLVTPPGAQAAEPLAWVIVIAR
jgi:hypothetical protein